MYKNSKKRRDWLLTDSHQAGNMVCHWTLDFVIINQMNSEHIY